MTEDRCYNGILHSAERLYLDRAWQLLGVDPFGDEAMAIEARLVAATLRDQMHTKENQRMEWEKWNTPPSNP